ncbi:chymotrypsin-like [Bacillus rossius redtenbacheri]|uniref:chymotrypsin-like n=1 Tax=Bacillus rossius redtenbacheri TaxID=93214 RepID=UPI002FDCFFA2
MKLLVLLAVVAAVQAKAVNNLADLEFVNKYVTPISSISSYQDASPRIVAGSPVAQGQIPWQALLVMDSAGLCSGVLVSSEWVLSAAHCLKSYTSFEIVLGGTSRASTQDNTVTEYARQVFIHANYDAKTIANDIGLLRLASLVTYNAFISAARLPSLSQISASFEGSSALVSGYGRTSSSSQAASNELLQTDVTVIRNDVCAETFGSLIETSNICTVGASGKSPCEHGDSGGPLVFAEEDRKYTLIGLVSFGVQNCPANTPAAYVRVTSYLPWISQNTGIVLRP